MYNEVTEEVNALQLMLTKLNNDLQPSADHLAQSQKMLRTFIGAFFTVPNSVNLSKLYMKDFFWIFPTNPALVVFCCCCFAFKVVVLLRVAY